MSSINEPKKKVRLVLYEVKLGYGDIGIDIVLKIFNCVTFY